MTGDGVRGREGMPFLLITLSRKSTHKPLGVPHLRISLLDPRVSAKPTPRPSLWHLHVHASYCSRESKLLWLGSTLRNRPRNVDKGETTN